MFPSPPSTISHSVGIVFSDASRAALQAAAIVGGHTYRFTGARGNDRNWLRGQHAYLAPNAASTLLNRCQIKHDWLTDADLANGVDPNCIALVIANAGALPSECCRAVERFLARGGRVLVTGRTNLPPELLGATSLSEYEPTGFTAWSWRPESPFGDRKNWGDSYVTGYRGHAVGLAIPAPGTMTLADLVELRGDLHDRGSVQSSMLGPAILATDQTVYVANQVFELLGGALQGHLNVEPMRRWTDPVHWGDTIGLFLRQLMVNVGFTPAWDMRLRAFASHDGVLSFRHDVHGQRDYAFLEYQTQALLAATYDIEDPCRAEHTRPDEAADWISRTGGYFFIEQALHNDSSAGDPPVGVCGTGLYDMVREGRERLGFHISTAGRHSGGHMHPETLDAIDYLYENDQEIRGLCTFSFYRMIEYGERNGVVARGKAVTYETNPDPTIASSAFWYPFQPVVTAENDWRVMRGWDRTHAADSDYEQIDAIVSSGLENPVYTIQYHPQFATDPSRNSGAGTLGFVRYAASLAQRRNLWIANQRDLYGRLADWQAMGFIFDGKDKVILHNPTDRRIDGLAIESSTAVGSVWHGADELMHIVRGKIFTVPPLFPGEYCELRVAQESTGCPRIIQGNQPGLTVLDARRTAGGGIRLTLQVCRAQKLQIAGIAPGSRWVANSGDRPPIVVAAVVESGLGKAGKASAKPVDYIVLPITGPNQSLAEMIIDVRPQESAHA